MNFSDGPSFKTIGPTQSYVLLNGGLSLVCGTGLDSNPQATITWTAPDGTTIMDNAQYDLENGPDIVRLNFTHTVMNNTGMWRCDITVRSERYFVSDGELVIGPPAVIGTPIQYDIQLTVIGKQSVYVEAACVNAYIILVLQLLLVSHSMWQSRTLVLHGFMSAGAVHSMLSLSSHAMRSQHVLLM